MENEMKFLLAAVALVLAVTAIPTFWFNTPYTAWNVYYERQAEAAFYEGKVPTYDQLSYGGRYMSFPQGYFAAKAAFLWLLDLVPNDFSFFLFGTLVNAAFAVSLVVFTRALRLRMLARITFVFGFTMVLFTYVLLAGHLMHVLSLALLFFALTYMRSNELLYGGIMLGASAVVHPFSLVLFPLFVLGLRCIDALPLRRIFAPLLLGFGIFAAAYAPVLLSVGVPYQHAADTNGYLLHWGFSSLITEFALAFPLMLMAVWFGNNRKLAATFFILAILYAVLSFRLNLVVAFFGGLLLAQWVHRVPRIGGVVIAILLLNVLPFLVVMQSASGPCGEFFLKDECATPARFLSRHERNNTVLAPLLYGHMITQFTDMKIIADGYVEYSDAERLADVRAYSEKEDIRYADKWNATVIVTERRTCDRDLVYDNGHVQVCWRR